MPRLRPWQGRLYPRLIIPELSGRFRFSRYPGTGTALFLFRSVPGNYFGAVFVHQPFRVLAGYDNRDFGSLIRVPFFNKPAEASYFPENTVSAERHGEGSPPS